MNWAPGIVRHLNKVHLKLLKAFKCLVCHTRFVDPRMVEKHSRLKHSKEDIAKEEETLEPSAFEKTEAFEDKKSDQFAINSEVGRTSEDTEGDETNGAKAEDKEIDAKDSNSAFKSVCSPLKNKVAKEENFKMEASASIARMAVQELKILQGKHSCQMAIAGFLESYVFGPSGFWTMAPIRSAAKFDTFHSLDCARVEGVGRNPRKGRNQILPSGNLEGKTDAIVTVDKGSVNKEAIIARIAVQELVALKKKGANDQMGKLTKLAKRENDQKGVQEWLAKNAINPVNPVKTSLNPVNLIKPNLIPVGPNPNLAKFHFKPDHIPVNPNLNPANPNINPINLNQVDPVKPNLNPVKFQYKPASTSSTLRRVRKGLKMADENQLPQKVREVVNPADGASPYFPPKKKDTVSLRNFR